MSSKRVLTIEITHQCIRICEMNYRKQKRHNIYRALSINTPINSILDGYINDSKQLGEYLAQSLKDEGVKGRDVVFVVSSSKIMSREVEIPMVKDSLITKVVQAQANEYMPVDIGDYIIAHSVLEKNKQEKKIKLMVFAAPKDLIKEYYDMAEAMGVKVESVDYVGNAAYQWLKPQIKDQAAMVVNIDHVSTLVTILDDGKLLLQRSVATGTDLLLQKENFGGGFEGAFSLEKTNEEETQISPDEEEKKISPDELEMLIGSLFRIMEYHANSRKGNLVWKIYICGEGAELPNIQELMTQGLEVETEIMKTCSAHTNHSSVYIACAGAALQPIDIIPYELADFEQKKYDTRTYFVMLGAVAAACAFVAVVCQLQYWNVTTTQDRLRNEISSKSYILKVNDAYVDAKEHFEYISLLDESTGRNNENLNKLFKELEDKLPTDSEITSITSAENNFSMSFVTDSKKTAAKVIMQLKEVKYVEAVYISGLTHDDKVIFQITCNYPRGGSKI